jgi:heme/copper-type cytochrome/quinol oxidase subunit 2
MIDKIGTYRGQCAELCGKDHGFMPIVVDVVSKADYKLNVYQHSINSYRHFHGLHLCH